MARIRVIIDNDFAGDPDGLFQLAHHALSTAVDVRLVIGSQLAPGDGWARSRQTAADAAATARELLDLCGRQDIPVVSGSEFGLPRAGAPANSPAARELIAEAMRDDDSPLYVACGGGLTTIASALLLEPRIAGRFTLVWIGGPEVEGTVAAPPGASAVEYNLAIDAAAARVVFAWPDLVFWQVPRNVYRQALVSRAELDGALGGQGAVAEYLLDALRSFDARRATRGVEASGTYILGDSPLVLLTALLSVFEPAPSSSSWITVPRPSINDEGGYGPPVAPGLVHVVTRIDMRLLLSDLFATLHGHP